MKTVRELALELELADLKYELMVLKDKDMYMTIPAPNAPPKFLDVSRTIIERASMRTVCTSRRDTYIVARAVQEQGKYFEYSYLVPEDACIDFDENLSVIGLMHEDFIHQLARIMREHGTIQLAQS